MNLRILGYAKGWIAIDKPSGLSVHNGGPGEADALGLIRELLAQADEHSAEIKRSTAWDGAFKPAPAHRLDRDTSGVLIIALSQKLASELQQAFEGRLTRKSYRAILRGKLEKDQGQWSYSLTDKAEGRDRPQGQASERKPCLTEYEVTRKNPYLTEIQVDLKTGRQHQIRRHAVLSGHEIVGDKRYGDRRYLKRIETLFGFSRLMLHAEELRLETSSGPIELKAPLPEEFALLFAEKKEKTS